MASSVGAVHFSSFLSTHDHSHAQHRQRPEDTPCIRWNDWLAQSLPSCLSIVTSRTTATGTSSATSCHPSHVYKPTHERHFGCCHPEHRASFPGKVQTNGRGSSLGKDAKADEPTSTPDFLLKTHEQEEEPERSERIATGEQIVPAEDATEWIESERDDWLDNDAAK